MDLVCRKCNQINVSGQMRCNKCHAFLQDDETLTIPELQRMHVVMAARELKLADAPSDDAPALKLIARSGDSNRSLKLQASAKRYLVGRKDGYQLGVDIDLDCLNAQELGVSRRHAVIYLSGSNWIIEDMGSSNGTYINGKRLQTREAYQLTNDDLLSFGRLLLKIQLEVAETISG